MRARLVMKETGVGLSRNLSLSVAVVITVAIAFALVGSGLLIRKQINEMKDYWFDKVNVSIFLCGKTTLERTCAGGEITEAQRQSIRTDLAALPQVRRIFYESSAQAFENYKRLFRNSPELVENVGASALPESFRVKLVDPTQFGIIADRFAARPGVSSVQDQGALLRRLFRLLHGFQAGAVAVAGVLAGAAVLLIFNAVRVAAFSRRRETSIMRLVGASRFYIQLPFILEGVVVGLIGSAIGAGLLVLAKWLFVDKNLKPSILSINFITWDWVPLYLSALIGGSVLLAAVASFLTISWTLRRA